MSFNAKALAITVLILATAPFFAWKLYEKANPTPPPVVFVPREEVTIMLIPGWNLRDVAEYLVKQGIASTTADVYAVTGKPLAKNNKEGWLAPETIRFYKGSTVSEVIKRFSDLRDTQITDEMRAMAKARGVTMDEVIIMASIVEREARTLESRKMIADILWRRIGIGWALQVDSSVHYFVDRTGDVYTTDQERGIDSPWNTYKHRGLPPTAISMPSLASIQATLEPAKNPYWYFLTGSDGTMRYAKTLDEHNANRYKYLR